MAQSNADRPPASNGLERGGIPSLAGDELYVTAGMPVLDERAAPDGPGPATREHLAATAIASDDVHVIKLTYTCLQEQEGYSDDGYLRAAALVGG